MPENSVTDHRKIIHVEVVKNLNSTLTDADLRPYLNQYIQEIGVRNFSGNCNIDLLNKNVESITFFDDLKADEGLTDADKFIDFKFYIYTLEDTGPESQDLDDKDEEVSAAMHWQLPAAEFHGLWETLIYDTEVKHQLLNFVETSMVFSDHGVNSNIISWNRVVLLHGPPGTGKTSLCKALAQKIAIRLNHRYSCAQLVEINSHSLFSKWFSESGKLVMKMFARIHELIEDPNCLVCVLIDEVESLAHARKSVTGGNEPSDSMRVVNALLTQIDQIKRCPNVLILTTSNISGTIDLAFIDRADIKQYIGLPTCHAIYAIYLSCLKELIRAGLLENSSELLDLSVLRTTSYCAENPHSISRKLWMLSQTSEGLSGRTLRKIPFLAHALFVHSAHCSLNFFLNAMERAIQKQLNDQNLLSVS